MSAAEATGSDFILKNALKPMDTMMDKVQTVDLKGERFRAWGPFGIAPHSDVAKPNVHSTLQAAVPFARAGAIILGNPRWKKKYGAQAMRYIAFGDSAVIQYWYLGRFNRVVPWLDTEHVPIWNDNATNMGLVGTYLTKYRQLCEEVALSVGQAFQAKLAPSGRGWIWKVIPFPSARIRTTPRGRSATRPGSRIPHTPTASRL